MKKITLFVMSLLTALSALAWSSKDGTVQLSNINVEGNIVNDPLKPNPIYWYDTYKKEWKDDYPAVNQNFTFAVEAKDDATKAFCDYNTNVAGIMPTLGIHIWDKNGGSSKEQSGDFNMERIDGYIYGVDMNASAMIGNRGGAFEFGVCSTNNSLSEIWFLVTSAFIGNETSVGEQFAWFSVITDTKNLDFKAPLAVADVMPDIDSEWAYDNENCNLIGGVASLNSRLIITVKSNNPDFGTVSGSGSYQSGTRITLTATPKEGYAFAAWNDGNIDNPRRVLVTDDKTYTATFDVAYNITAVSENETKGIVIGGGEYANGVNTTLMAVPNQGYKFVKWDDGSTENPRLVKVSSDAQYMAVFAEDEQQEEIQGETVSKNGVTITPYETKAEFTWPSITGVASYSLIIWANEAQNKKICTLSFNANGQVTYIDFAQSVKPQGSASVEGLNFTVTGLKQGSTYGYTLDAKNAENEIIDTKYGTFTTMGVNGIADITAAGINIYTEGRTIIVENATEAIMVSDALGCVVGTDDAHIIRTETRKFTVPSSGVYVVKVGNRAASVLVR